jgi:hypothetical protein
MLYACTLVIRKYGTDRDALCARMLPVETATTFPEDPEFGGTLNHPNRASAFDEKGNLPTKCARLSNASNAEARTPTSHIAIDNLHIPCIIAFYV